MIFKKSVFVTLAAIAIDLILLFIAFDLALIYKFGSQVPDLRFYIILFLGWSCLWTSIAMLFNLYEINQFIYLDKILGENLKAIFIFTIISASGLFFITTYNFSRFVFTSAIGLFIIFIMFWRFIFVEINKKNRVNGFDLRKVIMIGMNKNMEKIIDTILFNPQFGYKIDGVFTNANMESYGDFIDGSLTINTLDKVFDYCEQHQVDEMIVSLPHNKSDLMNELLQFGDNKLIRVKIIPEFSEYLSQVFSIYYVDNIPIMKFRKEPLESLANKILKRGFDIVFSLFVIIFILSWLFPIIAIAIKFTSKGPVLFKQNRSGKKDQPFQCLKFRSMTVNENSDAIQASKNDMRITRVGAFLRKTSIDELPQFFNVLNKQMSVVGPRPHMLKHTDEYKELVDKFMVRHYAKPGITGWAQISGFRGETKEVDDMKKRAEADIWYIENWSFLLDIKIIFLTVWTIFFKKEDNAF